MHKYKEARKRNSFQKNTNIFLTFSILICSISSERLFRENLSVDTSVFTNQGYTLKNFHSFGSNSNNVHVYTKTDGILLATTKDYYYEDSHDSTFVGLYFRKEELTFTFDGHFSFHGYLLSEFESITMNISKVGCRLPIMFISTGKVNIYQKPGTFEMTSSGEIISFGEYLSSQQNLILSNSDLKIPILQNKPPILFYSFCPFFESKDNPIDVVLNFGKDLESSKGPDLPKLIMSTIEGRVKKSKLRKLQKF